LKDLEPHGAGRRILSALALLWVIGWVTHQVAAWVMPVIPLTISVAVLVALSTLLFGRRRK
jgi:hypothetical protein